MFRAKQNVTATEKIKSVFGELLEKKPTESQFDEMRLQPVSIPLEEDSDFLAMARRRRLRRNRAPINNAPVKASWF